MLTLSIASYSGSPANPLGGLLMLNSKIFPDGLSIEVFI